MRSFAKQTTLFKSVKFWDTMLMHGDFSVDPRTVCGMAHLETVLTISNDAFMLLCFKKYLTKWKAEAKLAIEEWKQKRKSKKVSLT